MRHLKPNRSLMILHILMIGEIRRMKMAAKKIDPNQSTIIKPRRVYHCVRENKKLLRSGVTKDTEGKYHCNSCAGPVEDVTNTETGQDVLSFVGNVYL